MVSAAKDPSDPVVPSWIDSQDWEADEKSRAHAVLDRRTRMQNVITIAEMLRLMGKASPPEQDLVPD